MKYQDFVLEAKDKLGKFLKTAQDLAAILDNEITQLTESEKNGWQGPLSERILAFNYLCAIFCQSGLEIPELEQGLWKASLPRVYDKDRDEANEKTAKILSRKISTHLDSHVKNRRNKAVKKAKALIETLSIFHHCIDGFVSINKKMILAKINQLLVEELNAKPFRTNYREINVPEPLLDIGPEANTKVLIVDDRHEDLLKTALAIIGIPNIEIILFHYKSKYDSWGKLIGANLEEQLEITANEILNQNPQIVIMDQGLGNIEGSDLVKSIRNLNPKPCPIFVANTGGDGSELSSAGCLDNFAKGSSPNGFIQALRRIG